MFFADKQVYAGYSQHDCKKYNRCRGSVGRITAAVSVKHIINITYDSIHFGGIQVRAEEGNGVAVCLESTDESCDYQVKE